MITKQESGAPGAGAAPVTIVVGSDDNYAIGLAVTISSALRHLPEGSSPRLIVVDGGISPSNRERLTRVVEESRPGSDLVWHSAESSRFEGLKTTHWGSTANYLRLLMPEIIGDTARWALYLDSDLMVRGDLGDLWGLRLASNASAMAVRDYHNMTVGAVFGQAGCERLGFDADTPYFNSGMLLVNIEKWRDRQIPERAIEFVRNHRDIMSHSDQDALNAELIDDWEPLDPKWNVMVPSLRRFVDQMDGEVELRQLLERGSIYHFTGPRKPWLPGYWGPAGQEYREALDRSGWFSDPTERARWHRNYWAHSPRRFAAEAYRRARKKVAIAVRATRSTSG